MNPDRPDLSDVDPTIIAYIEALEAQIIELSSPRNKIRADSASEPQEPSEPPTTLNVIICSGKGFVKRTPRHEYYRQRRGGMGVFDIDINEDDSPKHLAIADETSSILVLTDGGRGFQVPVNAIHQTPIRGKGTPIQNFVNLIADEVISSIVPVKNDGSIALLSSRGYIRVLRHNFVSGNLRPGTPLLDVKRFGPLVASSWIDPQEDIFIATQNGKGIRFAANRVHPNGSLGIRLDREEYPVAVTGVKEDEGVFLLGDDGKGTIRLMSGFRSNKSPGAAGKIALKTDNLIASLKVRSQDDLFIISKLGKIIRFNAAEIPEKTGTVQGVICMALRADSCTTALNAEV